MTKNADPVVLDLASLPREQMGPFLLLGLDKSAEERDITAHWADRVKWARRNLIKVALEDINWAKELLGDREKRLKADAASLNSDTADIILGGLATRFGLQGGQTTRMWQPLDSEKALAEYSPAAEVPDAEQLRASITLTPVPEEIPAALLLLAQLAGQPLDPWAEHLLER
jgi:hypothetical protein